MKKFIGKYWFTITASLILTAMAMREAYRIRGYFAVGGEIFIPFVLILLRIEIPEILDFFKEVAYYGTTDTADAEERTGDYTAILGQNTKRFDGADRAEDGGDA